ncbi:MAG: 2'-5' RNA ligase family protein [Phycisphaerae bacterium]|nr:2'-5' RNA ligase family protein [Phycisphaerae bacterium]
MSRIQVRITIPEPLGAVIEPVRLRWNPEHCIGNPAHLTVIYHDEAPDKDLLLARLRSALHEQGPFPLALGLADRFPGPDQGAYLTVADPHEVVARLRGRVLGAPFVARSKFGLHATVLHPRYGDRLADAWPDIQGLPALGRFTADEIQVVGQENQTLECFRLEGEPHPI